MNLNIYRKFIHHSVIITELSRKLHVDYVLQRCMQVALYTGKQVIKTGDLRCQIEIKR